MYKCDNCPLIEFRDKHTYSCSICIGQAYKELNEIIEGLNPALSIREDKQVSYQDLRAKARSSFTGESPGPQMAERGGVEFEEDNYLDSPEYERDIRE